MSNACCVYDFTAPADVNKEVIITFLKSHTKKWTFQLEQGESGYMHYQGRFSLKIKKRETELHKLLQTFHGTMPMHVSVTSTANHGNMFYVTKEETRQDGPWRDSDEEVYMPYQYANIDLYPFQRHIIDSAKKENRDGRVIDLVFDPFGNAGKSHVAAIAAIQEGAITIPAKMDYDELIAVACNICMGRELRDPKLMFFDMPRAQKKDRLQGVYSALETIKNGHLFDCRYHYKEYWIDSPRIWVFSNQLPPRDLLSPDRWRIWIINPDHEFILIVNKGSYVNSWPEHFRKYINIVSDPTLQT